MKTRSFEILLVFWLLGAAPLVWAQEAAVDVEAGDGAPVAAEAPDTTRPFTTRRVDIPVAELALLVKPLTAEELAVEAAAWMKLLQAKTHAIAAAQVAVYRTNQAMAAARDEDAAAAARLVRDAAEEVKRAVEEIEAEQAEAGVDSRPEAEPAAVPDAAPATPDASEDGAAPAGGADPATDAQAGPAAGRKAGDAARESAERVAAQAEAAADAGADAVEDVAAGAKQNLLERVTALRDEQAAVIDRFYVVLDSWEAKGGDVTAHRRYINAVSGLDVDVSDASATWATIKGWFVSDDGGKRWLFNLFEFLCVAAGTWLVARVFGRVLHLVIARVVGKMSRLAEQAIIRSLKMLVWIIGLVIALSMLEVDISPLLAAIGAAGLVIGLALQGTLSNIASGVMILINRPFDVDDIVTAGGVTGNVSEMTLVTTIFRTFDNQTVIVPNNEIWGQVITNLTANETRRVDLTFGVGYRDDLDLAERIIREVVEAHELVLDYPEPMIKVHELGDSSVKFICRPWAKTTDYWTVLWDVTRQVKKRFDEEGVSIPFPQRDVHIYPQALNPPPQANPPDHPQRA